MKDIQIWASIVIAVCAFFVSIWAIVATMRHNRKPVILYLDINITNTTMHLANNGLGPTRITKATGIVDATEYDPTDMMSAHSCATMLLGKRVGGVIIGAHTAGGYLRARDTFCLYDRSSTGADLEGVGSLAF